MAWITLAETHVNERLTAAEMSALKSASRANGKTPAAILAGSIERAVNSVRGYVAANRSNELGLAGTIPDELEAAAVAIVVHDFLSRVPNSKPLLDDARVRAYKDALALLRDVSRGLFSIVPPESAAPADEQAATGGAEIINQNTFQTGRPNITGTGLL